MLSHPKCNQKRGCPLPTDADLAKARAIYAAIGMSAFVTEPNDSIHRTHASRPPRAENTPRGPVSEKVVTAYWHNGEIVRIRQKEG